MIRNKTIKFDMDKPEDKELWEYLAKLPHGEFTETVKDFFREQMYDQSFNKMVFNDTKKDSTGPSIGLYDIKEDTWRELSETIKNHMEEELPKDHPFRKMFE